MASRNKKRRPTTDVYSSDDGFVVNDVDEQKPQNSSKKAKTTPGHPPDRGVDDNGDVFWEISNQRRVTISSFKGKTFVNIREYYEKDGKELPGKKVLLFLEILRIVTIVWPCDVNVGYRESRSL